MQIIRPETHNQSVCQSAHLPENFLLESLGETVPVDDDISREQQNKSGDCERAIDDDRDSGVDSANIISFFVPLNELV